MHQSMISSFKLGLLAAGIVISTISQSVAEDDGSKNRFFRGLETGLEFYQQIKASGGWPQIPDGPALKTGMRDPRVAIVRKRLSITGDFLGEDLSSKRYDEKLKEAVTAYQNRNGQEPDGVLGKASIADLNISVDARIRQIMINQERWRRMPASLGKRFVLVNVAGFELDVIEGEKTVLEMRVVVGKDYHSTPMFSDTIRTIEINPYWNVPSSIANKELLPDYIKGTAKAVEQGFEITRGGKAAPIDSVDWPSYAGKSLPFDIRQRPGPTNALGEMKFLFPNKHNVYLHDTSSRDLFSRTVRAFSHGCVRIQKPRELAEYLLKANGDWSREKIDAAVDAKTNLPITLKQPVPVHLAYMTAWLGRKGLVQFRPDIYGRDAALGKVLFGG